MCVCIAKNVIVGHPCFLGENVVIEENVYIGDNAHIGHNVVVHEGTKIGKNVYIESGSILGRVPKSGAGSRRKATDELPPLEIGDDCVIGANAIVYRGTKIGNKVLVGDLASVREWNTVGDQSIVGRLVMVEPRTKIGNHVIIQAGTHITGEAVIEDDVFMGDEISTTNDNSMGRNQQPEYKGPHIKKGARIGSNATLLPGVVIGENAVVAAGTVVDRDVPNGKVIAGPQSRIIGDVRKLDFFLLQKED